MIAASSVVRLLCLALTVFWILLLIRVILSWLEVFGVRLPRSGPMALGVRPADRRDGAVAAAAAQIVPPAGMFDLSVVVAFIIIFVLQTGAPRSDAGGGVPMRKKQKGTSDADQFTSPARTSTPTATSKMISPLEIQQKEFRVSAVRRATSCATSTSSSIEVTDAMSALVGGERATSRRPGGGGAGGGLADLDDVTGRPTRSSSVRGTRRRGSRPRPASRPRLVRRGRRLGRRRGRRPTARRSTRSSGARRSSSRASPGSCRGTPKR